MRENMKKLRTERVQMRLLAVGMVILSVMLLAPLFAIAHYSVKSADDFGYFKEPEALWQSTHSLFTMIKIAGGICRILLEDMAGYIF